VVDSARPDLKLVGNDRQVLKKNSKTSRLARKRYSSDNGKGHPSNEIRRDEAMAQRHKQKKSNRYLGQKFKKQKRKGLRRGEFWNSEEPENGRAIANGKND